MKRGVQVMQEALKATRKIINKNGPSTVVNKSIESNTSNLVSTNNIGDARHLTARMCSNSSTVGGSNLVKKWHELHKQEIVKNLAKSADDIDRIYGPKIIARNILAYNTGKSKNEGNIRKVDNRADKKPNQTVCKLNKVAEKLYVQKTYQPEKPRSVEVPMAQTQTINKDPVMSGNLRRSNSDSTLSKLHSTKTKMESSGPVRKAQSTFPLTCMKPKYTYGHYCQHCTMMSNIRRRTPRQQSEFRAAINPESFDFSEKLFGTIKTQRY
ncbi:uncharacterized protein LOC119662120 [Teleopsis dalmanni]|uniref:uncharacterized protein LOC119662120 n=1 Tax=Teleopsis dalmanni TaxID=139649 RepID=UPI0018CE04AD|nr:uncharacterized protein LOC119662120 [Teleopsis dalmanni]XP_037927604.1 uncharacterized protein LOC119662120 [Teleopsis dalmanni]